MATKLEGVGGGGERPKWPGHQKKNFFCGFPYAVSCILTLLGSDLLIETIPGVLVIYFLDKIIPFLGHFLSVIKNAANDDKDKGVEHLVGSVVLRLLLCN